MSDATINGFKHYWEDAGQGEPIVMVHGAAGSSRSFAPQIAELSRTHRVIAVDLRGMGQSARVDTVGESGWVDDIEGLVGHLGLEKVNLYGTSLGARIILRYALNRPERVRCLILDNPIVANEASGNAALNQRMSDTDSLPQEQKDRYQGLHGDDWAVVVKNFFTIRNDPVMQEYLNLRELVKGCPIPTLLTRGDNRLDTVHPLPHVFELFYAMPNSRTWVKPEGGCFATEEGYAVVRKFIADAARRE